MVENKFTSPREEALEIAHSTRKKILDGNDDVVSILRSCLVVAKTISKKDDEKWIMSELSGYKKSETPDYREISCGYTVDGRETGELKTFKIWCGAPTLYYQKNKNEDVTLVEDKNTNAVVSPFRSQKIISCIITTCLVFLSDVILELRYGQAVSSFIEEIRNQSDAKIRAIPGLSDEIDSLSINLLSDNPADWSKVAHSCRNVLKVLADRLFPPREEKYMMKNNREMTVKEDDVINRLCAFIDGKVSGGERKFLIAEFECLESYIRQIVQFSNIGEHTKITRYDANLIAIHTYLLISELIKLSEITDKK